jgi:hypothetical protein
MAPSARQPPRFIDASAPPLVSQSSDIGIGNRSRGLSATRNKNSIWSLTRMVIDQTKYDELVELAQTCAYQARATKDREVAAELRQMAQEYQRRAAELNNGRMPDIVDVGT